MSVATQDTGQSSCLGQLTRFICSFFSCQVHTLSFMSTSWVGPCLEKSALHRQVGFSQGKKRQRRYLQRGHRILPRPLPRGVPRVKKDLEDNPLFQPFCTATTFQVQASHLAHPHPAAPGALWITSPHRGTKPSAPSRGDKERDVSSFSPRLHRCIPGKHSQVLFITNICSSENVLLCWVPRQCLGVHFAQVPETRNHTFATLQEGLCGSLPLLLFLQPVLWPLQFSLAISSFPLVSLSLISLCFLMGTEKWHQLAADHPIPSMLPCSCPPAHLYHPLQTLGMCCLLIMFRAFRVGKSRTKQRLVPGGIFTAQVN